MRTRTLLLLAVTCGLAILLAGTVQLLRLAESGDPSTVLAVGAPGRGRRRHGRRSTAFDEADGIAVVDGHAGGRRRPEGLRASRWSAPAPRLHPSRRRRHGRAPGSRWSRSTCTLTFATATCRPPIACCVFERADQTARWKLV